MGNHSAHSADEVGHHVPLKVHQMVLGALFVLTFITVGAAQIDFGVFNIIVAMLIASVKAGIVGLFFMHLKYEHPLIWLYVAFPLVLLGIMLGGIFIDNPFRSVPWDAEHTKVGVEVMVEQPKKAEAPKEHH